MSYGQYVYMLIYFSIDINALRAILLKSAIVNRKLHFPFHILPHQFSIVLTTKARRKNPLTSAFPEGLSVPCPERNDSGFCVPISFGHYAFLSTKSSII